MTEETTRKEHIDWAKQRASEYLNQGDTTLAFTSFASDMGKHPETREHPFIQVGMMMLIGGHLSNTQEMRKFIDGFN